MSKKRLTLTIISGVLCLILIAWVIVATLPKKLLFNKPNPFGDISAYPTLIAHGGGHKEFPDNTLEAFYNAFDADKNVMMETDVSITKDGVVILSHDTTIDRRSNKTGKICDWNYSDLIAQKVDFSYVNQVNSSDVFKGTDEDRIKFTNDDGVKVMPTDVPGYPEGLDGRDKEVFLATTLTELITAFPDNKISVEIKQNGELGQKALDRVLEIIKEHDAFNRVVVASFNGKIYNRLKQENAVNPNLMFLPSVTGVVKYVVLDIFGLSALFNDKIAVLQIPMKQAGVNLATAEFVQKAHNRNVAVQYWTIDDEDDMRHLIKINADGIMTNYPHKLKKVCLESFPNAE